jgi:periplasmic divalent cation tolerance protein
MADRLIGQRLAACVNILAPCRSVYRWQGKTEDSEEVPLLIKTTAERYAALEAAIRAAHPYELPEIVLSQSDAACPAIWLDRRETSPEPSP